VVLLPPIAARCRLFLKAMPLFEAVTLALRTVWSHKLRSFFTLLGVIVSVAFLVAVVAIIQGMNAYVRERLAGAIVGLNAFQIRRDPIQVGFIDDEQWKQIQRRPIIAPEDVAFIERAVPNAQAIALQSGWPTPMADVQWRNRTTGDVFVFGVTAPFVVVQDYTFAAGEPLSDIDLEQRRYVAVLGYDVADKLFGDVQAALGRTIRVRGMPLVVKGVIARKGTVLGQSWDGFVMLPLTTFESMYGRRQTMVISVKMPTAATVAPAMLRAEEAMRIAHRLRPGADNDFTIDTGEGLIAFWGRLTRVIFTVVPAVVVIGIVVGGIVIMNIMLMSVTERTREIGIRKALGAARRDIRRQFFAEALTLSLLGVVAGIVVGFGLAGLVQAISPLPARVTAWSIGIAITLGLVVGVIFGVYPAHRASRLDPIEALRQE
jgi:putative ABC transport system permease protein